MSTAKNIQARVFGGQETPNGRQSPAPQPELNPLSIQIPKLAPATRPKLTKPVLDPSSPKYKSEKARDSRPYRERVIEKLGAHYEGVERHRLDQDEQKERHWKRWGPYLSERQWVSPLAHRNVR